MFRIKTTRAKTARTQTTRRPAVRKRAIRKRATRKKVEVKKPSAKPRLRLRVKSSVAMLFAILMTFGALQTSLFAVSMGTAQPSQQNLYQAAAHNLQLSIAHVLQQATPSHQYHRDDDCACNHDDCTHNHDDCNHYNDGCCHSSYDNGSDHDYDNPLTLQIAGDWVEVDDSRVVTLKIEGAYVDFEIPKYAYIYGERVCASDSRVTITTAVFPPNFGSANDAATDTNGADENNVTQANEMTQATGLAGYIGVLPLSTQPTGATITTITIVQSQNRLGVHYAVHNRRGQLFRFRVITLFDSV